MANGLARFLFLWLLLLLLCCQLHVGAVGYRSRGVAAAAGGGVRGQSHDVAFFLFPCCCFGNKYEIKFVAATWVSSPFALDMADWANLWPCMALRQWRSRGG